MSKKTRLIIGAIVVAVMLAIVAFGYFQSYWLNSRTVHNVLTVTQLDLATYKFKDGNEIEFGYSTNNGVVKSPIQVSVSPKGTWPDNSEIKITLTGPYEQLFSETFPVSSSDEESEAEDVIHYVSTFRNRSGGKGSFVLEKSIVSNGAKDTDSIAIPVDF